MTNNKINHTIVKDISFSLLEEGISVKIRADGYSMYPVIKPGSFIYIEPVSRDNFPCPGEIVAWKRDSGLVVHRLVRIIKKEDQTLFVTRGDSCIREDIPVKEIAGKVVRIENEKGKQLNRILQASNPNYHFNHGLVLFILTMKKILSAN